MRLRYWSTFLCLVLGSFAVLAAPAFIWREAETPDASNFTPVVESRDPALVSGGKWLSEAVDKSALDTKWGAGRQLSYKFTVEQPGDYRVWLHLGYESVRAALQWRIDDGPWQANTNKNLTTNMIELSIWNEVAWADGGAATLTRGAHTLQIEIVKPVNDRLLYGLDAFCLVQGAWTPDALLKPSETPKNAIDVMAAETIYRVPAQVAGSRAKVPLNGLWQIARFDDPDMDTESYAPVRVLPAESNWRGVQVPGSYFSVPELNFAHRVLYRTKVEVPATLQGRSFLLDFSGTNWIASVFVNGQFVDWRKSTRVPWQCDITAAVKPGQVNEIVVAVKSCWYSIDATFHKRTLDESRNIPVDFFKWTRFVAPIYPSSKGGPEGAISGITDPVQLLIAGGPAYVADAFIKTSVTDVTHAPVNRVITAEITVANPTAKAVTATVSADAVFVGSGKVEKRLSSAPVIIPAGGTQVVTLTAPWPDAKLWWPEDDPANLYQLSSTVTVDGKAVDVQQTTFGFREVKIDGKYIRINGIRRNSWNLLGSLTGVTPTEALANYRKGLNRFERFGSDSGLQRYFPLLDDQLSWTDAHGVPGRLSSMVDGMFITMSLGNPVTWENYREHTEQRARAFRNHPSVIVYSLENEILAPNTNNGGYRGIMDQVEAGLRSMQAASKKIDPTRPCMIDDQGALNDNSLDIANYHYAEDGFFADNAKPLKPSFEGRNIYDGKRPLAAGEIAYFSGNNADHAWIGGESAAASTADARKAYAKYVRYIFERYRWNDVTMIFPWIGNDGFEECRIAMSPLAAFTREYGSSLFGNVTTTRTVKVFNDTLKAEPVTFTWTLAVAGKRISGESRKLTIAPGFNQELTITFTPPTVKARTPATLTLEVTQAGSPSFKDVKEFAIFPPVTQVAVKRSVYLLEGKTPMLPTLTAWGIKATVVAKWNEVTAKDGIILVGPDVLQPKQSVVNLVAYAKGGGRVIFLEQDNPIQGAELPATLKPSLSAKKTQDSYFNFGQGFGTPFFADLGEADFSNWSIGAPTAKAVWEKPSGAARSWVGCGKGLTQSALVEIPCGPGELLATQLTVGAKLGSEPAAEVVLRNLLLRADSYAPPSATVTLYAPGRTDLQIFLTDMGCKLQVADELTTALDAVKNPILVVDASKANLEALLAQQAKVQTYTNAGGWMMLWGLTPQGLAAYNNLLGTKHLIREFRVEAVRLQRDIANVGLESPDVTMSSKEVVAPWSGLRRISSDTFTYCVDGEDIAPFCFPLDAYKFQIGGGGYNLVNGLVNGDFWFYIDQIPYTAIPPALELHTFTLPVACQVKTVKVWNNANYDTIKDFELRIDGKAAAKAELPDSYDLTEFDLKGQPATTSVGLYALSVRPRAAKQFVGLDLVKIIREQPDWYKGRVFPLVDVGGLVRYPRGKGGFLLNEIKLEDSNPTENLPKKQRIVSGILQNLGAAFGDEVALPDSPATQENPAGLLDPSLWHKKN